MYDSSTWEDFAAGARRSRGAGERPQLCGVHLQRFWHPANAYITKRGFPHYFNCSESFPGVACADSDNPHTYAAWSAAADAADAQFGTFGRIWTWASSICAAWPNGDADRYIGPWNHNTSNPVLVIGNLFDPATRYQGAVTRVESPAELAAADGARLGAHVAVHLAVRRRGADALPGRPDAAACRDGVRAGSRAVHRPVEVARGVGPASPARPQGSRSGLWQPCRQAHRLANPSPTASRHPRAAHMRQVSSAEVRSACAAW